MGRQIYFSDDELIELEMALEGHESSVTDKKNCDSAFLKVGVALERPWAVKQQSTSQNKNTK